jgi:hypothetical protein
MGLPFGQGKRKGEDARVNQDESYTIRRELKLLKSRASTLETQVAALPGDTIYSSNGLVYINVHNPSGAVSGVRSGASQPLQFSSNNSTSAHMYLDTSGLVGVGTTSPQTQLTVGDLSAGTSEATNKGTIQIQGSGGTTASAGGLEFKGSTFGSGYGWRITAPDSSGVNLRIMNRVNSAAWTERMIITQDGLVGIGTTDPSALLHVSGAGGSSGIVRFGKIDAPATSGTYLEVINQRNDSNATFGGRIGLSQWRSDGTAMAADSVLGAVYFGGQHGGSTSFNTANNLYSAAITAHTGEARTSASNLGTSLRFYTAAIATASQGRTLTEVNNFPGVERMRITADGRVGIGTVTGGVATSALLDLTSTTGALLVPRMTTAQRDALTAAANGMIIYNTSTNTLQGRQGGAWTNL